VTAATPGRAAADSRRRALTMVVTLALPPAIVAGAIGLLGGAVVAVVALVVVGVAVAALIWVRAGRVLPAGAPGRSADPVADARLINLVEGLCTGAGVRVPDLRVVDAPGLNLAVSGRDAGAASLVVTSGLLGRLSRMELEGVLAAGIVQIRRGDVIAATVAAATGIGVATAVGTDHDLEVDAAAVALTRYPPGLRSALQAWSADGTAVPGVPRRAAHLWLAEPLGDGSPPAYRRPLQQRVDALSEL
jgi:Zn-dependent protease with chaperone function